MKWKKTNQSLPSISKKLEEDLLNDTGVIDTTKRSNMDFTTTLESKNITISKDHSSYTGADYDFEFSDATINWTMSIEARSWGVKSIYPYIRNATFWVEVIKFGDDEDTLVETIEIADSLGWEFDNEFASKGDGLCPQEIYVNFPAKKVLVEF